MDDKQKPSLSLVRPDSFEDLMALVTRISGRAPTPEERERAKAKLAQAGLLQQK